MKYHISSITFPHLITHNTVTYPISYFWTSSPASPSSFNNGSFIPSPAAPDHAAGLVHLALCDVDESQRQAVRARTAATQIPLDRTSLRFQSCAPVLTHPPTSRLAARSNRWHAVAHWEWDVNDDCCGICRYGPISSSGVITRWAVWQHLCVAALGEHSLETRAFTNAFDEPRQGMVCPCARISDVLRARD